MNRLRDRLSGPLARTQDIQALHPAPSLVENPAAGIVVNPASGLVAVGVGKTYKKRPVVRNVSIQVRRGEAVGLLGPNGAGKTTTFYMIVGLVRPDTGTISLDGQDITGLPMYRRARLGIGYLPQEASVFRGLNVEQNVMASLKIAHRGYVLENGRIELSGSGAELLSNDLVRKAYLGL